MPMPTQSSLTAAQKSQIKEAAARAKEAGENANGPTDRPSEPQVDSPNDALGSDPMTTRTPIEAEATDRKPPVVRSPKDEARNEITARFRKNRSTESASEEESDAQEIRRFAREGMPPELIALNGLQDGDADPALETGDEGTGIIEAGEVEAEEQAAPVKRKLKVNGKDRELSEDEITAAAQMYLAADGILDEAKAKMRDIDALMRSAKENQGTRSAPTGENQTARNAAQTTDTETPIADDGENQTDNPFTKLIETIQYGKPEEAAASLQQLVTTEAGKQSKEALRNERLRNDGVRSQKVLKDFMEAHPDLASDEMASAAIERTLFSMQKQDLLALGLEEATIPQTPAEIAKWHQFYRVEGHNVRDAATLLTDARDNFLKWRGGPVAPKVADPKTPPKIAVVVDRSARRAAIPQQPSRSAAPKPDTTATQKAPADRASVVQNMKLLRAKPRGQVLSQ